MTRDEAIARLKVYRDYCCKMSSWLEVNEVAKPFNIAIEALERPHGEWVLNDDQVYECKDCGYVPSFDGYTYFNYCPNCGSEMRGDND